MWAACAIGRCGAAELVEKEGQAVEVIKSNRPPMPATIGLELVQRDRLSTGVSSRAVLRMREAWDARVGQKTLIEITDTGLTTVQSLTLNLLSGQVVNLRREVKGEFRNQTPAGLVVGTKTQVFVRVLPGGRTFVHVIEGEMEFTNAFGAVVVRAGEAVEAAPGSAPQKEKSRIDVRTLLQWALYYPAVLLPHELELVEGERQAVAASLRAYAEGDLIGALDAYPISHTPTSAGGKLYQAAVWLGAGRVEDARQLMQDTPPAHPGRVALERMLAAVLQTGPAGFVKMGTAGEALAESYYRQSRRELDPARAAARRATELAPQSGFTWTRLAEMEFSFGDVRAASAALTRGLQLSPRNAQAHALQGFFFSADHRMDAARQAFERAIELDGALGNAWLGLGLTKIRQGRRAEGRRDLQMAAMVEPTRAFFYSYHGKALEAQGAGELARKDFNLAKLYDPDDPTAWLYSALQLQHENRAGEAVQELRESIRRNANRSVYRSEFLLDQDRAVRSANLATIYQHNGMVDVAVREATRAVEDDYTNPSAHLFLANSLDAVRDPQRTALRHETAWFNELLLASLLAPVGGGSLSQFVSQQEYSRLLDADGFSGRAVTEWRDDGRFDQRVSLAATRGRLSAGVDFSYWSDDGSGPNNDTLRREGYGQFKYQVSGDDVLYTLGKWERRDAGDVARRENNAPGNAGLRNREKQEPGLLLAGWNHRWAPGMHTLLIGSRLAANETLTAPATTQLLMRRDPSNLIRAGLPVFSIRADGSLQVSPGQLRSINGLLDPAPVTDTINRSFDFATQRRFLIHAGELQHLWQTRRNLLLVGGRWQGGRIKTKARLDQLNPVEVSVFTSPAAFQDVATDFERRSVYGYDFFHLTRGLTLLAGASWDWMNHPENFRLPPVSERQVKTERLNGKAGFNLKTQALIWRGAYAESLGGVTYDESVRLEPAQLAGFNQAFRTVIPEALAGSVEAPAFRNWGASVEGSLGLGAWWALSGNVIEEKVTRTRGAFNLAQASIFPAGNAALPSGRSEQLSYREETGVASLHRLVGNEIALGAMYRVARAGLRQLTPQIPISVDSFADQKRTATLQELILSANWNSPSGWFAWAEAKGYAQDSTLQVAGRVQEGQPGDQFVHLNMELGRRFARQRRQLSAGVLNVTGRDHSLPPLSYLPDLPRARTFFVRGRFDF